MSAPANRQPHIQGLRGVAVVVVVLFHAGLPLPGGFLGVDVFFVISGFVITAMLLRELEAAGRIDFARFYMRRFKRLTPALALTIAVTCLLSAFVLSPLGPQQTAAETGIGAIFLFANVVIDATSGGYFDAPAAANPLLNIWSLSVEEQFYLGFPLLMFLGWTWARRSGRTSHVLPLVAIVGIASFALAVIGSGEATENFALGFYSPLSRAWEFAAGSILALTPAIRWTRPGAITASMVGAGILLWSLLAISEATPFPGWWTMPPVLATVLLLSAGGHASPSSRPGFLRSKVLTPWLASTWMVRIGDWSYSIYLWHWPIIVLATTLWPGSAWTGPGAAALALVPALLSYRFLEQPIRSRDFRPARLLLVVSLTILLPLAAAIGLRVVAEKVWKPQVPPQPAAAMARHAGYVEGCHYEPGDGSQDPRPCVWNAAQSGNAVYLLGDSNAAQFEEALIDATKALQRPIIASTSSGCPLLDIEMQGPEFPGYGRACLARNGRLLGWLRTAEPGTVVLAASDDYWIEPGWAVVDRRGRTISERGSMVRLMQSSLHRVVEELRAQGHRVLLVQSIPHWKGAHKWDPARCTLAAALEGCTQRMPLADALDRAAEVRSAIATVAESTASGLLDVTSQVCPRGECRTATSSMPIYRDATHITVAMSHALAPQFTAALRTVTR